MNMKLWVAILLALVCVPNANAANIKLLYFYKTDCQWCAQFDDILIDKDVAQIMIKNTDIVRINVLDSRQINDKFMDIGCDTSPQNDDKPTSESGVVPWRCPIETKRIHENDLVKRFAVKQTPTLIFFSSAGKELLRIPGFLPKKDFLELLCNIIPSVKGCN